MTLFNALHRMNDCTAQRCTDPIPGQAQRPKLTPPPPPPAPTAEQFRSAAQGAQR